MAHVEKGGLIIADHERWSRQDLYAGQAGESAQDYFRRGLRAENKVESRRVTRDWHCLTTVEPDRAFVIRQVVLHAILQPVGQRHFGDRGVDADLFLRSVELANGAFDHPVIVLT